MGVNVTLNEAATYLGVSKATLRNWDNDGKLTAIRNPVNGYRLYDMNELIVLKKAMGGTVVKGSDTTPKMDSKTVKRVINKLHCLIRDGDANSNIVTRFDEISKLLFVKLHVPNKSYDPFEIHIDENVQAYSSRIQSEYLGAIECAQIQVPGQFRKINLDAATLYKCGTELSKIDLTSADYDIKGLAYEDIIKGTFDKSDNQQFFTPHQIVDFMVHMMEPYINGTVCDPACGTAGFLVQVAKTNPDVFIQGMEVDERLAWVSRMNLLLHGHSAFDVVYLQNGGSLGENSNKYFNSVDTIITNPPFGSNYTDRDILNRFDLGKDRSSRRRGILFIEQSWNLLVEGGVVAIIIDQGVLNAGSNSDVRKYILDHFRILAIIDLPETTFMPYASVSSSILILQKTLTPVEQNGVFFAKSSNVGRKSNGDDDYIYSSSGEVSLNSDLSLIIENWRKYKNGDIAFDNLCYVANVSENLEDDKSLRLDYAFHHPFRNESKETLERAVYPLLTLAEICDERNESYIPASDSNATTILFTGLANIEPLSGKTQQVVTPAASIKSAVKRYEPNDIVFSKMRPSLRKTATMRYEEGGYVSSECMVLTVRKAKDGFYIVDPELLSTILRSDFVYGQIMGFVTGIGRPRIGGKDLRKIKIPIPPHYIQKEALGSIKVSQSAVNQLREKARMLEAEADRMEQGSINEISRLMSGEK